MHAQVVAHILYALCCGGICVL